MILAQRLIEIEGGCVHHEAERRCTEAVGEDEAPEPRVGKTKRRRLGLSDVAPAALRLGRLALNERISGSALTKNHITSHAAPIPPVNRNAVRASPEREDGRDEDRA